MERFDDAILCYNKELECGGFNIRTLNNRGYSFAKLGRYKEAISDYN